MKVSKIIFYICLGLSILLIVIGFIVPPTGVIDGSVLTAVGELFGFAALGTIPTWIEAKRDIKITKGDTCIEINDNDD